MKTSILDFNSIQKKILIFGGIYTCDNNLMIDEVNQVVIILQKEIDRFSI